MTYDVTINRQDISALFDLKGDDLHPSAFSDTAVTFTEVFGFKALFHRAAGGFEFAVDQSFGAMVLDYLARATAA
jgi:sarcosine oxidase subunit gamma